MRQRTPCVLLITLALAYSAETPPGGYPPPQFDPQQGYTQFLIPRAAKPPVIDGQVEPGEWDQAVELNVMADQTRQWTPQDVECAFAACGRTGLDLGPAVGFRYDWPWENLEACDRAWRRLR